MPCLPAEKIMELSIDTSTRYASVCLSREGEVMTEYSWFSRQNHSVELLPAVDQLLKTAGVVVRDLECVVIAIGPGGFSALRVGLSTAKGLGLSLGIPLVALNTLDIEADPYQDRGLPVCSILDIGRGEVAAALYAVEQGRWNKVDQERIMTPEELCDRVQQPTLFCGEGVSLYGTALQEHLGDRAVFADQSPPTRRPATLARMGYQRLKQGEHDNIYSLEPFYLRRPTITAPRKPA
jgi:tRNA threonylcarbamoyladenosine biosynthesis protein TsaB